VKGIFVAIKQLYAETFGQIIDGKVKQTGGTWRVQENVLASGIAIFLSLSLPGAIIVAK
jgi:hypothetical protein